MAGLRQRLERLEAERGANRTPLAHLSESELSRIIACGIRPPRGEKTEDYTRDWLDLANRKMTPAAFAWKYRRFADKTTVAVLTGEEVDPAALERWVEGTVI
jgi:hypothetical protein